MPKRIARLMKTLPLGKINQITKDLELAHEWM
jgi:hypothetical protein